MSTKRSVRESGIELLRILAALSVVMLHYNFDKAFDVVQGGSPQQYTLFLLESVTTCAVDLFVMISGFFLSGTQKRTLRKPFELIVQLIVFHEAIYVIMNFISNKGITISGLVLNLIPINYFVILYIALYFVSQFINLTIRKLNQNQWIILLAIMIVLFSIWNTAADFGEELIGNEIKGISTISQLGSIKGHNIVNFCLAYILGAYFRYAKVPAWMEKKRYLGPAWIGVVLLIFLWSLINEHMILLEMRSAWVYHNPLVLFSAVLLFQFFRQIKFNNKVVNRLAGASFTCFLIHHQILERANIEAAVNRSVPMMLGHIVLVLLITYAVSWVVYECYNFTVARLLSKLNWRIFKPWEIDI